MKTVNLIIYLTILIISTFVSSAFCSEWVEYGRNDIGTVYAFNKFTVKHTTRDIVQVSVKRIYSDEGRKQQIQNRKNAGLEIKGYENLSHDESLEEIDCRKGKIQILSTIEYDKNSFVLDMIPISSDWNSIPPNSRINTLREIICKGPEVNGIILW